MDWFNIAMSSVPYNLTVSSVGAFFVGVFMYMNEMVGDIQTTLQNLDKTAAADMWPTYVDAIRFHNDIMEYDHRILTNL